MSKFGRNGYEASFGLAATGGSGGGHHYHSQYRVHRQTNGGGDGGGVADGGFSDDDGGGGGGAGTGGNGGCGSRADDLNSLDGAEEWVEMLGAVPTPASETACRVVVNIRSGNAINEICPKNPTKESNSLCDWCLREYCGLLENATRISSVKYCFMILYFRSTSNSVKLPKLCV